ncbi:MAG: flippase-like domain-containing protein, partial [Bacteroidaceae bacterium]|nr:flippase-like domain-containing protein [Bacteroidaceae bacterium]
MGNKTRNIFFIFGLVAIVIMILTFKVSFVTLWNDLKKAGYWLIPILCLWLVLYVMNAWTWRIIIKGNGDCPVSFWRLLKVTISGFALNYATPGGLMGGEPYKIMEMKPYIG